MFYFIKQNPAILFIVSILFYWSSTAYLMNPIAITFLVIGVAMMFKPFKPLALVVGFVFLLLNGYLILALFSEFREFPEISKQAILMLGVGGAYIALNIYIGIRLIFNNLPDERNIGQLS